MYKTLTRKQIRMIEKNKKKSAVTLKKGTSLLGTAMLVSSLSTPFLNQVVSADEGKPEEQIDEKNQVESSHLQSEYQLQSDSSETTESSSSEGDTENSAGAAVVDSSDTTERVDSETSSSETEATEEAEEIIHGSDNGKEFVDNPQSYTNIDGTNQIMARSFAAPNQQQFIDQLGAHAREVAAENDLYASVMIAQAILESGWGGSSLSKAPNYNLFGIKGSYNGQSVTMQTKEYLNGKWVTIYDQFRAYPSFRESLQDNARVLKTTSFSPGVYFYSGVWKSNTTSYRDATSWLTGRYATDPSYNAKLNNIIETYQLTQYDTPNSNGGNSGNSQPEAPSENQEKPGANTGNTGSEGVPSTPNTKPSEGETYTIVSGDTLSSIARRFGTTVAQLKSWNQLKSDLIFPGQQLIVRADGTPTGGSEPAVPSQPNTGGNQQSPQGSSNTLYTVVSGDSLYAIGQRYGVSVAQLKSWNKLSSDTIYPGQKLIVKVSGTSGNGGNNNQNSGTPAAPKPGNSGQATYTVIAGDSLYAIGQRYGVSVAQLKSWNQLKSDLILPGQKLIVKAGSAGSQSGQSNGAPNSSSQGQSGMSYTVVAGDNLYLIGQRYGVSVAQLKNWNKLHSDLILPGQKLIVRAGNGPTAPSPNTSKGNSQSAASYTIKAGDTLYAIALKYNVSVAQLMQWNHLSTPLIFVGQQLIVSSGATSSVVSPTTNTNSKVHTVKSGDTLWGIAQQYHKTVDQLKQKNQLQSDIIYIGQKIIIA